MNWIDLVLILILGFYFWDGYHRGFFRLAEELLGIIIAFILALRFYSPLSEIFSSAFKISSSFSKPLAFFIIWLIVQAFFYFIGKLITLYIPSNARDSKLNHYFGIIPGLIKGVIFVGVMLVILIIMPLQGNFKKIIEKSFLGNKLLQSAVKVESQMENIFSNTDNSLTFFSESSPDSASTLNFSTTEIDIDETSEKIMLDLINNDRLMNGVPPLQEDLLLRNVARTHSRDMLLNGFFSHTSSDGKTLVERLTEANVNFQEAAENIALAPTVKLAEIGLMNSPKHRDNILDKSFTRVGIGIMDSGANGLMVTQIFVN